MNKFHLTTNSKTHRDSIRKILKRGFIAPLGCACANSAKSVQTHKLFAQERPKSLPVEALAHQYLGFFESFFKSQ